MNPHAYFLDYFRQHPEKVGNVVDFNKETDRLLPFDFTLNNQSLPPEDLADTTRFSAWVEKELTKHQCRYGIGGYNEHRILYARSAHFDHEEEPRRLHLGTDIWGPAGTPVYSPLEGRVHSFNFNNNFGDYGATIILEHNLEGNLLHTLFGHLDLASLQGLEPGKYIERGQQIARFGVPSENGFWPPHLHLQLICDMQGYSGDYPGVCRFSQREEYLNNCPDPDLILQYNFN